MTFKIGNVDFMPYIAPGGLRYSREDREGANGIAYALDGSTIRDRVAIKDRLEATLIPLDEATLKTLFDAIEPEFVEVTFTSPRSGVDVTKTMYSNNIPATICVRKKINGQEHWLWSGITFPLVEK